MNRKKTSLPLICAAVFLIVTACLRYFNIFVASAAADVAYNGDFVRTLDSLHDILVLAAYGFSVSAVVYSCRRFGFGKAVLAASLMSAVVFADRAFCFVYDVASSNINIRETGTVTTAVSWLLTDFLFFAAMYFGGALISRAADKSLEKRALQCAERKSALGVTENDGSTAKNTNVENKKPAKEKVQESSTEKAETANVEYDNSLPLWSLGASVGIMTLLQIISQIVICVQFFMEYDDVTATEKAQMAGDILWILVEYGGILAAFAMIFYAVVSFVHGKVSKKS